MSPTAGHVPPPRPASVLAALVAVLLMAGSPRGFSAEEPLTLFQRVAQALEQEPPPRANRFASIALARLFDAYLEEARAAQHSHEPSSARWSRAVEGYAFQILRLKELIESGAPVTLVAGALSAPAVVTGNFSVMLTHPRPASQSIFEHLVVEEFCALDNCRELLEGPRLQQRQRPQIAAAGGVNPRWEFSARGPACSHRGIHIAFETGTEFGAVRATCTDLFRELEALIHALRWQRQHQVLIDWSSLRVNPSEQAPEYRLQLNQAGDTAVVELSLLQQLPQLIPAVTPWLKSRLNSRPHSLNLKAEKAPEGSLFTFSRVPG